MSVEGIPIVATPAGSPSYLDLPSAQALAAALPPLAAWMAATDDQRVAALVQATSDIDNAMWYQGRPYDPDQDLAFPRVAHESRSRFPAGTWGQDSPVPDVIWDWDSTNNVAVVPPPVLQATLYQADSILDGSREQRLADQHDGLSSQGAAGVTEAYKGGDGLDTGLARRAFNLMIQYQVRTGRLH